MKLKGKFSIHLAAILVCALLFTSQLTTANAQEEIIVGEANWPGIRAKNAVFQTIVENIGYEVDSTSGADVMIQQGVARGDIDVHLDVWMPVREQEIEAIRDQIEIVATNMDEGIYTLAVLDHTSKEGITSHADLNEHADKFDHTIYVGEPGWSAYGIMETAVEDDIYNLGDWELQTSSEPAMMSAVERAHENEDWIVFAGWRPHWMDHTFDITFLDDPNNLWKSPEDRAITIARLDFAKDHPEIHQFLTQFKIDVEYNSQWIYEIGRKERDPDQMAKDWITNNWNIVEKWLEGVESSNGKPAFEVLRKNL